MKKKYVKLPRDIRSKSQMLSNYLALYRFGKYTDQGYKVAPFNDKSQLRFS